MGLSSELSCESGSLPCCRLNPHGCFHSGLRLYFPMLEPWVARSASLPTVYLVYLCPANVGPRGLLVVGLPAHTPPVLVPPGPWESSPPRCPSPPLLLVWMNVNFFISFVSDSLAVRFSVSSGCARRRSVSTYASILVLSENEVLRKHIRSQYYCE